MPDILIRRPPPPPSGPPPIEQVNVPLQIVFIVFLSLGLAGNLAMLLTAIFAKRVVRHISWINFCVAWVVFSISYMLLFLANAEGNKPPPSYQLCLTQAGLVYGAPVLTAYATVALVIEVVVSTRAFITNSTKKSPMYRVVVLLVIPYVLWFAVFLAALISGAMYPKTVNKDGGDGGLYCQIMTGIPGRVVAVLVGIALVLSFSLEVYLGVMLRKNWRAIGDQRSKLPLSMMLRVTIFMGGSGLAFSTVFVFLSKMFEISNLVMAIMPFLSFLAFGTQRDIISVWTFRK
ncbi:hypothetical protein QCA50_014369 [Cerrena zonata]|uniref:G-protein coupled receptors family 1 profile domain-containing protein n=1 Tax=Cerrena zonata TaxID=2478898 RepID=A0AAW0FWJ6_9APHY